MVLPDVTISCTSVWQICSSVLLMKASGIERELVIAGLADAARETIRREVAARVRSALVRDENVWQRAAEQRPR